MQKWIDNMNRDDNHKDILTMDQTFETKMSNGTDDHPSLMFDPLTSKFESTENKD